MLLAALILLLAPAQAEPSGPAAVEEQRIGAPEANQGVVADARYLYAIDNARIAKIDRRTGKVAARWQGDPRRYKHMNSCTLHARRLVCAASNYPDVPMASSVETFDADTLRPVSSRSLGPGRGSLTWLTWHDGSWWACFANYEGKGGEPGRDNRWTTLVRYSADFAEQGAWIFPPEVLARMAPKSASGGDWNRDGYLYVTGHDRPEMYVLKLPQAGPVLELVTTIAVPVEGQAIAWDPVDPRLLWGISRGKAEMVAARVPVVTAR
ncbi:hypothetical protein ACFQ1E_15920 [Sphingomonas canadensis]|uniref:Uncharacterized protein n=1 Tax=Sphingomonas canadensis TaxID=1219257 RepID=A0ABW3HAW0_9SPHN|nr:hypothetical protein [Sphingomonas canadensis]MCW3837532.1 hypothetical protein [Sphingomonas canadensis]